MIEPNSNNLDWRRMCIKLGFLLTTIKNDNDTSTFP